MMRKIYMIVTAVLLTTAVNAQKALILMGGDVTANNDKQIAEAIGAAGFEVDTVNIALTSTLTLSNYDVCVITETPSSGPVDNNFLPAHYLEIPVVNLKAYSLQKVNTKWLEDKSTFFVVNVANYSGWNLDDVAESTKMEILEDHDIFTNIGVKGDEISFADDTLLTGAGAHIQTIALELSIVDNIKNNSTTLASSTMADELEVAETGIFAAIEENATCLRTVAFGLHSLFQLSEVGLELITNSCYWAAGLEIPTSVNKVKNVNNVRLYPNPVSNVLNISNIASVVNIQIVDITGKVVANVQNNGHNSVQVNASEFVNGIYMVRYEYKDGQVYTDKLMK